jgi:hypothetical protein
LSTMGLISSSGTGRARRAWRSKHAPGRRRSATPAPGPTPRALDVRTRQRRSNRRREQPGSTLLPCISRLGAISCRTERHQPPNITRSGCREVARPIFFDSLVFASGIDPARCCRGV